MVDSDIVLMVGPFPPPLNGAAKNTLLWSEQFDRSGFEVHQFDTSVGSGTAHNRSIRYHIDRIGKTLGNFSRLVRMRPRNAVVYMVPDGGLGLIYNIGYSIIFRFLGVRRIWLHHRNLQNIAYGNRCLKAMCWLLSPRVGHIFLTSEMKNLFLNNIGNLKRGVVIGNAATCDIDQRELPLSGINSESITIGFLSNLNSDKGFDIVAGAIEYLAKRDGSIEFLIAGAPTDTFARELVTKLKTNLGSRVRFLGHVSGESKKKFYSDIDVFLFPSTYKLEAQPNVVIEALASGVSVVSTNHACIPETLINAHHRLIDLQDDREQMAISLGRAVIEIVEDLKGEDSPGCIAESNISAFEEMKKSDSKRFESFFKLDMFE